MHGDGRFAGDLNERFQPSPVGSEIPAEASFFQSTFWRDLVMG